MIGRFTVAACVVAIALVLSGCSGKKSPKPTSSPGSPAVTSTPSPVPPELQSLYNSLSQDLDGWQQSIDRQKPLEGAQPVFGGHLLAANANRGSDLLQVTTIPVVDASLDSLKALGLQGVTITISFPLLNADYPHSADYLKFYETVAQHVRDRGLMLSVEQHVAFSGTAFSSVQYDYSKLSFDDFVSLDHEMTKTILANIKPDYLTLLSEPDTFGQLTGYRQAATPQGAADMVRRIIDGQDRGSTKLGAGAGSWLPNAVDYDRAFAALPLDYIDLHVYPLTTGIIQNTQAVADAARAAGKPVVLDEAWLYKSEQGSPGGVQAATGVFRLDSFSFFAPLDARFLGLLAKFARMNGVAYVAPFWTNFFWGYVDYTASTKDLPYQRLEQLTNQATVDALRDGTYSDSGQAYGAAIAGR